LILIKYVNVNWCMVDLVNLYIKLTLWINLEKLMKKTIYSKFIIDYINWFKKLILWIDWINWLNNWSCVINWINLLENWSCWIDWINWFKNCSFKLIQKIYLVEFIDKIDLENLSYGLIE